MTLTIISFGYLHDPPPPAHITIDVRHLFRDPHVDPSMRELTGRDQAVIDSVLSQPGAVRFVRDLADVVSGLSIVYDEVLLAVGCAGGRHRSVVIADAVADLLKTHACRQATVKHRDIDKPVVHRTRAVS